MTNRAQRAELVKILHMGDITSLNQCNSSTNTMGGKVQLLFALGVKKGGGAGVQKVGVVGV